MSVQTLQYIRFHPATASEDDWEAVIDMQLRSFAESNPDDPVPPRELIHKQLELLEENPFFKPEVYLLRQADSTAVGRLFMGFPRPDSPDYEQQKHMGFTGIYVFPEHRKQGIGRHMLEHAATIFQERGLTLLQGDTDHDSGRAFAERFGSTIGMEARMNRLYMKDIDWELVESWRDECAEANPDVSIETFEGLPDEADIEAYARLYTEVANQQPFEELEGLQMTMTPEKMRKMHEQMRERGDVHITRITREADGSISGLTEISYNPQRPHRIGQELTGVQQQYRGRGLGKWLKADMLLFIREQYPDVEHIATGNADVNAPMLSINERLGFKLYKHATMYKLQLADAMKHLDLS